MRGPLVGADLARPARAPVGLAAVSRIRPGAVRQVPEHGTDEGFRGTMPIVGRRTAVGVVVVTVMVPAVTDVPVIPTGMVPMHALVPAARHVVEIGGNVPRIPARIIVLRSA